jgi:hypothetical protein
MEPTSDGSSGEGGSDSGGDEGGGFGASGNTQGVDLILDGKLTDAACSELLLPAGIMITVYMMQKKTS